MKGSSAPLLNYVMTGHWIMSPPRVFGGSFTVDHSLICKIEGFVTKPQQAKTSGSGTSDGTVFSDFKTEPVL